MDSGLSKARKKPLLAGYAMHEKLNNNNNDTWTRDEKPSKKIGHAARRENSWTWEGILGINKKTVKMSQCNLITFSCATFFLGGSKPSWTSTCGAEGKFSLHHSRSFSARTFSLFLIVLNQKQNFVLKDDWWGLKEEKQSEQTYKARLPLTA